MKRAEFIKHFVTLRKRHYHSEVKAGRMRWSEAAMGMADAEADAIRSWRKGRATLSTMSVQELTPDDKIYDNTK